MHVDPPDQSLLLRPVSKPKLVEEREYEELGFTHIFICNRYIAFFIVLMHK